MTRNGAREASGVSVCQTKEPRTRKTTRPANSQNEFHRCRRNPREEFRRDPYQKVMGWLLPRAGKSQSGGTAALGITDEV